MTNNTCPSCYAPVDAGAKFCPNCGQPIQSAQATEPKPMPSPSSDAPQSSAGATQGSSQRKPSRAIWWIVGIAAALVIAIAIPSISQKDPEGKYVEDFVKWNRSNNPGTSDAAARTAAKELYRTNPAAANRLIESGGAWSQPSGNYTPSPTPYEEAIEKKVKHSIKDLKANLATINSLAEKIVRQQATLDSAASPEEKIKAIDALLATYESALEVTQDTIGILEENQKDGYASHGYISEAELRENLSSLKNTERVVKDKISELKRDKAALEGDRQNP